MRQQFNTHLNELARRIKTAKTIIPTNETEKELLSQQIAIDEMRFEQGIKVFSL